MGKQLNPTRLTPMKLGTTIYHRPFNMRGVTKSQETCTGKIRVLFDDNVLRWVHASDIQRLGRETDEQRQSRIAVLEKALAELKREPVTRLGSYVMPHPHEPDEDERDEIQGRIEAMRAAKIASGEISAEFAEERMNHYA